MESGARPPARKVSRVPAVPHTRGLKSSTQQSQFNCIAIEDSKIGVESAKAANLNCLLILPPWNSSRQNISKKANACLNSLGNFDNPSRLIYGKKLISNHVDFDYLTNIIN